MNFRLLKIFGAASVVAAGLASAGAAPAVAAPYCAADSLASYGKVQVWADPNCSGGSVIIRSSDADDDRPNFGAFRNYDGKTFNVDNSRSSLAVAAGTCVRVYDGVNYTGEGSNILCGGTTTGYYGLFSFDNRVSSLRTCPASAQTQCGGAAPAPAPTPTPTPTPTPAPGPAPVPVPGPGPTGAIPAAWSNGPVNAPKWEPAKTTQNSLTCGLKAIPAGLPPQSVRNGWTPRAQAIINTVKAAPFSFASFGGSAANGATTGHISNSFHYCGRGIDAYAKGVKSGSRASGAGLASSWKMANWAAANASKLNVAEVIFYDKIWSASKGGWRPYTHSSGSNGNTVQHRDHVHLSIF